MKNCFNTKYRPCPECTYPLANRYIDELHTLVYCTNKNCPKHYQKLRTRKAKK